MGMGTGLVYLLLAVVSYLQLKYTRWELDDVAAFSLIGLMNPFYAPVDGLWPGQPVLALVPGIVVAVGVWTAAIGVRLVRWVVEENSEARY